MKYLQHSNDHDFFTDDHIKNFLRHHKTGADNFGRHKLGQIIRDAGYKEILDAPAGSAVNFEVFKNQGLHLNKYIAFDLTQKLLDEAKRRYGNEIMVCKGYVQEIDKVFADNSIECIICRHVFEHLPPGDMETVVQKMFNVAQRELILVFFLDLTNNADHIYEERSSNIEGHPEITHFWNQFSNAKLMSFLSGLGAKIEKHYIKTPGAAASDTIIRLIK